MGYFDVLNLSGVKCEKLSVKFMCCITDKRNSYLSVKQFHPARCALILQVFLTRSRRAPPIVRRPKLVEDIILVHPSTLNYLLTSHGLVLAILEVSNTSKDRLACLLA